MQLKHWLVTVAFLGLSAGMACSAAPTRRPFHPAVRVETARATALRIVSGRILAEELEREHGRWIYSFEIRPTGETGRRIREVNVDAQTGALVGPVETELAGR